MKVAKVASVLQKNGVAIGDQITVRGWVRGVRKAQKTETFLDVSDGSSIKHLQVITYGCSVEIEGELVKPPSAKQDIELSAKKVTVVGPTDPLRYPLQAKGHPSMEFLREINHLRPRTNFFGGVLRLRNASLMNFHNFLQKEGFICVHTPIITNNDCEGGGQAFQVVRSKSGDKEEFFGSSAFLTVSGQLEAEMMACAMSKVYTFGPTFRAEDSHTSRHLAEFTMLEPEFAWANLNDCMNLSENMIKSTIQSLLNSNMDEIQFFNDRIDKTLLNRLKNTVDKKFDVITYTEAVDILQKNKIKKGKSCVYEDIQFGMDLGREHEKYLTEELFNNPVYVINWPKSIKPFYMRQNDDGVTVAAMDLLVPEVGEIIGGSAREERPDLLEEAMKNARLLEGESSKQYQWYLQLRQFGTVPHGGFGLGYERFIQYITGIKNIRDVIPCPRYGNSFNIVK